MAAASPTGPSSAPSGSGSRCQRHARNGTGSGAGCGPPGLDIDKLLRSTFDALKDGGLIVDDSRIVAVAAGKVEVPAPEWTGAMISIGAAVDPVGQPWAELETVA